MPAPGGKLSAARGAPRPQGGTTAHGSPVIAKAVFPRRINSGIKHNAYKMLN